MLVSTISPVAREKWLRYKREKYIIVHVSLYGSTGLHSSIVLVYNLVLILNGAVD